MEDDTRQKFMKPNKKTRQEKGGTKNIEKRWIDAAMALPAPKDELEDMDVSLGKI